ncbi:hypothetical protein Q8A73_004181 [Channa argus]|nr:hypothetical protein Q8A73_004181 [Channa argus]
MAEWREGCFLTPSASCLSSCSIFFCASILPPDVLMLPSELHTNREACPSAPLRTSAAHATMSHVDQHTPSTSTIAACEDPLFCKHYLIPVMRRGPSPPPRRFPGLWELKPTLLAGTKDSPPLPLAPCLSHCCPSPPHNKRGHGTLIPRQRYKWWPRLQRTSQEQMGLKTKWGGVREKWQRSHKKVPPPPPPPHPRSPFVGMGEGTGGWGLRRPG